MMRRRIAGLVAAAALGVAALMVPAAAQADSSWGDERADSSWGYQSQDPAWGYTLRDSSWG